MVLITILLDPVLGFLAFVGLLAFVIWALITLEAVIKLFKEILQWLHLIFIYAKKIVSYFNGAEDLSSEIQENDFAGMNTNESARGNELYESPV